MLFSFSRLVVYRLYVDNAVVANRLHSNLPLVTSTAALASFFCFFKSSITLSHYVGVVFPISLFFNITVASWSILLFVLLNSRTFLFLWKYAWFFQRNFCFRLTMVGKISTVGIWTQTVFPPVFGSFKLSPPLSHLYETAFFVLCRSDGRSICFLTLIALQSDFLVVPMPAYLPLRFLVILQSDQCLLQMASVTWTLR